MPYIAEYRDEIVNGQVPPSTPGELNYLITTRIINFLEVDTPWDDMHFYAEVWLACRDYILIKGMSYTVANEVAGVLYCAEEEMWRRVVNMNARSECFRIKKTLNAINAKVYAEQTAPYENDKIAENGDVYPDTLTKGVQ